MENTTTNPAPITHTLFNMVSLRSPQLSNETQQPYKFIQRPTNDSLFDEVTANLNTKAEKWNALKQAAANFEALGVNNVKENFSDLYSFGIALSSDESYISSILKNGLYVDAIDNGSLEQLWNNLIYQVITQKDFYVKEAIMQILAANHLVTYFNQKDNFGALGFKTAASFLQTLANAAVVLPYSLFATEDTSTTTITPAKPTSANSFMQNNMANAKAKMELENLQVLKTETEKLHSQYNAAIQTEQAAYTQVYNQQVAEIMAEHVQLVAARNQEWLANNGAERYNSDNPFMQPELLPEPTLPRFEYTPAPEISIDMLAESFSPTSLKSFMALFNYEIGIGGRGEERIVATNKTIEPTTFKEILQKIDSTTEALQNAIANTTSPQTLLSIGGVLVSDASNFRNVLEYQCCPVPNNNGTYNIALGFDLPDPSWEIASMNYNINNGAFADTSFNISVEGNSVYLSNLFPYGIEQSLLQGNNIFEGTISFTNGVVLSFIIENITHNQCFVGVFTIVNGVEDNAAAVAFLPNGFGYKQIGIADYKKVEQTLHGYVPGEVSHIENIMAREYKEKSTRRSKKSENTETTSSETEREQLTDTSSTSRFELQSEISKVLQETRDFNASANFNASYGGKTVGVQVGAAANYATHSSKEESARQAQTEAKEITQKALDRLVTKVKTERTTKIIEEYEENNLHGFDNKKGDKHVSGVYRWLDKIMKNRIVNFGKRLIFEFMVPQPAKLHTLVLKNEPVTQVLVKPEDPRMHNSIFQLSDYAQVTEASAKYWAGKFNAAIKPMPALEVHIGHSFDFFTKEGDSGTSKSAEMAIPDGYYASKAAVNFTGMAANASWGRKVLVSVGNQSFQSEPNRVDMQNYRPLNSFVKKIPLAFSTTSYHTVNATITVACQLSNEALHQWQLDTFKAIVAAYEDAEYEYNTAVDAEKEKAAALKTDNPNFYRQIENTILRKNCISYLVDKTATATQTYGLNMGNGNTNFSGYEINNTAALDQYTALAKFLEQAFEWNVMSYNLYPFYWANKQDWSQLYQTENVDPLFRSFLQSGMARVVVTVRPGFENAVQHYMATGQIWNGGQVPVLDQPLYLSLVDELKEPTGTVEGKAWISRVPTTLTLIQANSIGLPVSKALPCITDDAADFENPDLIPDYSELQLEASLIENNATSITDVANIEIDNGELQLTNNANPSQVIAAIPIADIKTALGI